MRLVACFSDLIQSVVIGLAVASRLLVLASSNHTDVNQTREHRAVRKLTITTVLDEPYMMMKEDAAFLTGNERFQGYVADILRLVAAKLGFDYEICLSTDGKYGQQNDYGQWNGIIGEVVRGERDIAAGAVVITSDRQQVVHFSESFMTMRSAAVLLKPSAPVDSSQHSRRRQFYWQENGRSSNNSRRRPSSDHRRRMTDSVQLIQSADYEFGVLRGGVAHQQLSSSSDPLYRAAWIRLNAFWPSAFIDRLPEGLDRVRRRRQYALIVDSPTAEYVTTRRPCDLYASDPFLDAVAYGFAIGRRVPAADDLRAAINRQLSRLHRDSVLQTLYLHWWRSECSVEVAAVEQSPVLRRRSNHSTALNRRRQHDRQTDRSPHHDAADATLRLTSALNSCVVVVSTYLLVRYCTVL